MLEHRQANRIIRTGLLAITLLATMLAGCSTEQAVGPDQPTKPELSTGKPALLRAIDSSVLSVVVRIEEGGYEFIGEQRTDSTWFVQMNLPPDMTYNFYVNWYANTNQQRILLLEQRGQFFAGSSTVVEPIDEIDVVSVGNGFDADCDGMSNLFEVENDSDPLSIPSGCIIVSLNTSKDTSPDASPVFSTDPSPDPSPVFSTDPSPDISSNAQAAIVDIAIGGHNLCVIDANGRLECATDSIASVYLPPDDGTLYNKVDSGDSHTCAITQVGDIRCWGLNSFGQSDNVPTSLVAFTDLSAGENHTCAIDANGQIYCWGLNTNGQSEVPADNQGFASIHAGGLGNCAIRTSGIAECWSTELLYFSPFIATKTWTDFVFPDEDSPSPACGLTTESFIGCWSIGNNRSNPINGPFTQIGANDMFLCGLKFDGELECSVRLIDGTGTSAFIDSENLKLLEELTALPAMVDFDIESSGPSLHSFCGIDFDGKLHCVGNDLPADNLPG